MIFQNLTMFSGGNDSCFLLFLKVPVKKCSFAFRMRAFFVRIRKLLGGFVFLCKQFENVCTNDVFMGCTWILLALRKNKPENIKIEDPKRHFVSRRYLFRWGRSIFWWFGVSDFDIHSSGLPSVSNPFQQFFAQHRV